ncbi:hypothetical protein B9Z19DRAFT_1110471 [Tuber borchii]|uniref:ABM domain-containing protein n=1 Tax=Tuber borchii TaxID=42251 RepID=A0A2T6ZGZ2_TUBBO|nr:hypothetical protein B9Z19DRAFT_1110471 [Tuber borchii]
MAILEFAIFTLHPPNTPTTPAVKTLLGNAQKTLTSASGGHPFTLLTQIESPNTIYLIGSWDSVAAHNSFLASGENQRLLAEAKDVLSVDVMYHAEMNAAVPLGAPVLGVGRHHVKPGMKSGFEECFGRVRGLLRSFTGVWEVAGGWRVDEGGEEKAEKGGEEWLLFTGWESVEQHQEFGKSEEFKGYAEIREFLEGFEVKHAVKYEV